MVLAAGAAGAAAGCSPMAAADFDFSALASCTAPDLPIIGSFEEADAIGSTTYCESKSTCTHELEAKAGKRIVSYR